MDSANYIPIVLCADKNVVVGLHVALYSVLSTTKKYIKIYILHKEYDDVDKNHLFNTLNCFDGSYEINFIEVDDAIFSNCTGLYGNTYAFVRLLIPRYIEESRVVYVDTDVVFNIDIGELYRQDMEDFVIGATSFVNVSQSRDGKFFESLGLNGESPYFNSGVMLIDLAGWRRNNVTNKCIDFVSKYGGMIRVADETVLNVVFHENFKRLDRMFNYPVIPTLKKLDSDNLRVVFHLMQSPKPWNLFGEFMHGNYDLFESILKETYFKNFKSYKNITIPVLKHSVKLLKAYKRCIFAIAIRAVQNRQRSCPVQDGIE